MSALRVRHSDHSCCMLATTPKCTHFIHTNGQNDMDYANFIPDSGHILARYCRKAAPESRYGLEVQQTLVQNKPILFVRSRSSLVLKPFTVFAVTESLFSIFHLDTTWWEKKNFLIFLLQQHLTSFNECLRVLPAVSMPITFWLRAYRGADGTTDGLTCKRLIFFCKYYNLDVQY